MLRWFDSTLTGKPAWVIGGLVFPFILLLGFIDLITAYPFSISAFYLIPISIAAWYGNHTLGYIAGLLSAAWWVIVQVTTLQPHVQQWIPYWNTATHLVLFTVVAYLVAELKVQLVRQQQLARMDDLTGLLSRAGFFDRAAVVTSAAARYGNTIAAAYIDLDNFKNINDTWGHSQGDEVLKSIGYQLSRSSRKSDVVARLGGDEFSVLLPNTNLPGARVYFNNLHSALQSELQQRGWSMLGISVGAAVFDQGTPDIEDALRLADSLMYRAKGNSQEKVIVER